MSHNYQLNFATAGDGKPRVLELWDGSNRICALTSPEMSDERLQLDLGPLIEAANSAEGEDELKDRISDLETERDDAEAEKEEAEDKVSGLEDKVEDLENQIEEKDGKISDLEGKVAELEDRIAELENGEGV